MNICFAIGTLSYSGAEKIMFHLLKELLKDKSYQVSVILISSDEPCEGLDGVTQYPIYRKEEIGENRFKRTLIRQKQIRDIVRENKFDVLVSFGVVYNIDVAQACIGTGVKLILCERNDPVNDPGSRFNRVRRSIFYHRGNGYVFQTETIRDFFPKRMRKRSVVIPNFMDKQVRIEDKYHPQRNVIATSARLDEHQKNQKMLIQSFAMFASAHKDYILEFYGDGPDKEMLRKVAEEEGVSDKVVFKGRVSNPMSHIRNCRVFVLSSVYEGMPNALIEALAYGMPCISSDCSGGGAKALIEHGINGMLFEVGNKAELVDCLNAVCDDEEYAEKLGEKAYQINEDLHMSNIIPKWLDFFTKVAESK